MLIKYIIVTESHSNRVFFKSNSSFNTDIISTNVNNLCFFVCFPFSVCQNSFWQSPMVYYCVTKMRFLFAFNLRAMEGVYKLKAIAISLQVHPIQNEFITFSPSHSRLRRCDDIIFIAMTLSQWRLFLIRKLVINAINLKRVRPLYA